MSKPRPQSSSPDETNKAPQFGVTENAPAGEATPAATDGAADVPKHRQCPGCFRGDGGVGKAYNTQGRTRYYKCNSCGHTWRVKVDTTVTDVTHRQVDLDERETK